MEDEVQGRRGEEGSEEGGTAILTLLPGDNNIISTDIRMTFPI